jgi:hypothetical protein
VTDQERGPSPGEEAGAEPAPAAATALGEEAVLNAAVAFAGHVVTAAEQAADKTGVAAGAALRGAVFRQYLLETATLCLRKLGESYTGAGDAGAGPEVAELLRDGVERARGATATVEALGDLSLDILDHLLGGTP